MADADANLKDLSISETKKKKKEPKPAKKPQQQKKKVGSHKSTLGHGLAHNGTD
jgi:hypothetical protein